MSTLFDFQSRVRTDTSRDLILDFTNVPYVDSAGIGALVGAYVTHQKDGRSLFLIGVNERVQNALKGHSGRAVLQLCRFGDRGGAVHIGGERS